jgi:uncharacterized protein YcbX
MKNWRCWFGHKDPDPSIIPKTVLIGGVHFDLYPCVRCGVPAYMREVVTGARYADLDQYLDERSGR